MMRGGLFLTLTPSVGIFAREEIVTYHSNRSAQSTDHVVDPGRGVSGIAGQPAGVLF